MSFAAFLDYLRPQHLAMSEVTDRKSSTGQLHTTLIKLSSMNLFSLTVDIIPPPSSSSCRAARTDIPDPLSPLFPIVHRPRQIFWTTSRIFT